MTALIETTELHNLLQEQNVKIFDVTYPASQASLEVIPGSEFFDIDVICATDSPLPHMIPSAEEFEAHMQKLGINKNDTVVVYDQKIIFLAAARGWWMLRLYGFDNVRILNGGMPKWIADGYDTMSYTAPIPPKGDFKASFQPHLVKTADQILNNVTDQTFQTIDVRSRDRFDMDGHIPGSANGFFMDLIDPNTGTLKPTDELKKILSECGIDMSGKIATSCGSGVTACVTALALFELGVQDVAVYDGSWTEWSSRPDLPKHKNAPKPPPYMGLP